MIHLIKGPLSIALGEIVAKLPIEAELSALVTVIDQSVNVADSQISQSGVCLTFSKY
jgi:hypothetical protein